MSVIWRTECLQSWVVRQDKLGISHTWFALIHWLTWRQHNAGAEWWKNRLCGSTYTARQPSWLPQCQRCFICHSLRVEFSLAPSRWLFLENKLYGFRRGNLRNIYKVKLQCLEASTLKGVHTQLGVLRFKRGNAFLTRVERCVDFGASI